MATKKKTKKAAPKPKIEKKAKVEPGEEVMEAKPIPDEAEMQEKFAAALDDLLGPEPKNGKNEVPAGVPLIQIYRDEAQEMADQIEWGLRTAGVTRPHRGYEMADRLRELAG